MLTLLLVSAAAAQEIGGRAEPPKSARTQSSAAVEALARIGQTVQAGGADTQRDFARIALEEMISAYQNEAQQALAQPPEPPKRSRSPRVNQPKSPAEMARWAARTSAYAEWLGRLLEGLNAAADDVRVLAEGRRTLRLLIGATSVVVSGPRINEPQLLAAPIVRRACLEMSICDVQEGEVGEETFPIGAGEWSFTQDQGAVLQIKPGLRFVFPDAVRLADRQKRCLALAQALKSLARELKDRWLFDARMELDDLAVLEGGGDHVEIYLGAESGALPVESPLLQTRPQLLREALPWLRGEIVDVYVEAELHPPAEW
ncbi:MAG TPA: hypothetical protein VMH34_03315 [Gammaproteobacteria bacterium]|nr:hypothetical protein [Gammaproteobacteria bacterium]